MQKILVVEDDVTVSGLVRNFLEGEGYLAVIAIEGEAAWATLLSETYDAAVVDLSLLGDWTGWDLIERIRGHDGLARLPIVVFTGQSSPEVAERAAGLNCAFLTKPFSVATLLDRLQLAMAKAGATPPLRPLAATMFLDGYRVEGEVHVQAELDRFSDAWEAIVRDARSFVPVTRARLTTPDGRTIATADLIEVRKDDVIAVFEQGTEG